MQKSGIILIVSGALIVIGLFLMIIGNQIILEGVSQENALVSINQELFVATNFDPEKTSKGVFAVQIMNFRDDTFVARIVDSSENEMMYQEINEDTLEKEFKVDKKGDYKLIVESKSNEEIQVFGAIGPLPDAGKKSLGFISVYVIVVGMVGLVLAGIYGIKNRKKSI